uniref:Lipocalin n=1 Tax=Rhipicephalus zambeziensis TaxID=60191 RepID=A0A224YBV2_9ACAR
MRRCVSVILFTCIFIFTSSYSHWTAVDSQYCPVMNTSGIRCVNRTLNSTLCTKEETMEGVNLKAIEVPVYSQNPWYLVGYSSGLEWKSYSCVKSPFVNSSGSTVHRKLLMRFAKTSSNAWDVDVLVKLQIAPCTITVNVTRTCQLARYTKVQPQYVLLSYNWDSFVLSEPLKSVEEQPLCSLWAKEPYKKAVPMSTYNYFLRLCKDPKNASYPASCE